MPSTRLVPAAAQELHTVPSPCIGVCTMNHATGFCEGCRRTIDEIATWSVLNDDEKRAVLAQLPARC